MMCPMNARILAFAACLLAAGAAAAETVYKYRRADGRVTYSNRLLPGLELIETFDAKYAEPAAASPGATKSDTDADARIKKRLAAFEAAWTEVQEATKALNLAQARLDAGVGPLESEGTSLAGPPPVKPGDPIPPSVLVQVDPQIGGPQAPAKPEMGGPSKATSPSVGGPMGTRRGGGRNAEYAERMASLEADVRTARERLDAALRNYNRLR